MTNEAPAEMPGQMSLFETCYTVDVWVDGNYQPVVSYAVRHSEDEVCKYCGQQCESSKECAEIEEADSAEDVQGPL